MLIFQLREADYFKGNLESSRSWLGFESRDVLVCGNTLDVFAQYFPKILTLFRLWSFNVNKEESFFVEKTIKFLCTNFFVLKNSHNCVGIRIAQEPVK